MSPSVLMQVEAAAISTHIGGIGLVLFVFHIVCV